MAVTDAYFSVQQARGELAGAIATTQRMEELVRRTKKLAPALAPELEIDRAEAELVRRQGADLLGRDAGRLRVPNSCGFWNWNPMLRSSRSNRLNSGSNSSISKNRLMN